MILCPVRDCHLPLMRDSRTLRCERRHSFDVARSGYINLLQPQERRSKNPGDTLQAVAARRRLHERGVTEPLRNAIGAILGPRPGEAVLDAGCGDGYYLGTLARELGLSGHGIDISTLAVDAAARRYPQCEWIVGNADRFIPYSTGFFSSVISITARRNTAEFRRILKPDGRLLIALPAPEDLIELRGVGRDRVERTVAEFAGGFDLIDRSRAATSADLDEDAVRDILHSIYRPLRAEPPRAMRVTFSLDLLLFRPHLPGC